MALHESQSRDSVGDEMPLRSNEKTGETNGHHIKHADDKDRLEEPEVNLSPSFTDLGLPEDNAEQDISGNFCLAHLKLRDAIQALKEDIGYTDGLWGL
ncbi:hypothetical protein J3458_002011 [Metarhizium acridum]|uniref:uncharacterized protein n=1 Tax=Metarhizium acridum TaxID=92637 RepID=UPI001C6D1413|nr:hypothetical protein J3458_002011 [Metarhizium acridum]